MTNDPKNRTSSNNRDRNVPLEDIEQVEDRDGRRLKAAEGYSADARKIDRGNDEDIDGTAV